MRGECTSSRRLDGVGGSGICIGILLLLLLLLLEGHYVVERHGPYPKDDDAARPSPQNG